VLSSRVQSVDTSRKQVCPHNGFAYIKKAKRNPAGTKYVAYATKLQRASGGCISELFEERCQLRKQGLSHLRIGKDRRKKCMKQIKANPNV